MEKLMMVMMTAWAANLMESQTHLTNSQSLLMEKLMMMMTAWAANLMESQTHLTNSQSLMERNTN